MAASTLHPRNESVKLPKAKELVSLTTSYAYDWEPSDAFRELYQNWKDEIIDTHRLSILNFRPFVRESEQDIVITICSHNELETGRGGKLGYLRFEKSYGVIVLTNFGKTLESKCLGLGYSTKVDEVQSIARKGVGLKIAALVLTRNEYHLRIETNETHWKFALQGCDNRALRCSISPNDEKNVDRDFQSADLQTSMASDCMQQVSIIIKRRSNQNPISPEQFWEWMRITIDINPPPEIVRTVAGDLILSPEYAGSLYIRGILASTKELRQTNAFHFGYNFLCSISRPDRDEPLRRDLRSRLVSEIWARAIASGSNEALAKYTELLQNYPDSEDTKNAENHIDEPTAKSIWSYLAPIASAQRIFFCVDGSHQSVKREIREVLQLEPSLLSHRLWRVLRKFYLVHTLQEQVFKLMLSSRPVEIPRTLFALEVDRALRALLAADPSTANTRVKYVHSPLSMERLAFHETEGLLFVSSKWLETETAHTFSNCVADITKNESFFCDHVPEELYNRAIFVIAAAWKEIGEIISSQAILDLFSKARYNLRDMPRRVQSLPMREYHTIGVQWENGNSNCLIREVGMLSYYRVILHAIPCIEQREALLFSRYVACECPSQTVPLEEKVAIFRFLDTQARFPVVARCLENAICGVPPPAILPYDDVFTINEGSRHCVLRNEILESSDHLRPSGPSWKDCGTEIETQEWNPVEVPSFNLSPQTDR